MTPKNTKYTVNNPFKMSLGKYLNKTNIPKRTHEPTKGNCCASDFVIVSVSPFATGRIDRYEPAMTHNVAVETMLAFVSTTVTNGSR